MSFHQKRKNIETISVKMCNCQSIQKCPDFKDSFMIYLHFFLAYLTLKAPIATKVVCLSRLPKCLRSIYGRKCGPRPDCSYRSSLFPIGAVCSGSTLFASILDSSVMLGNYMKQTTSADDIFRCIFSWRFKG